MNILGISGSLRTVSVSTALLKTAATLMPGHAKLMIYDGLGNLPHFNPEIDKEFQPPAVSDFRSQLNNSAGVIISTPEYAHGVPGVLKNALDWLVASGELYQKPVALFSASPRGCFAHASLIETLSVMMARLIPEAFIKVSPPLGMAIHK
jgi:NAD(P)H-dependent FMN reductase